MSDRALLREMGRRVRRARLERNLSQERVAELAGLSRMTVVKLEKGTPSGLRTLIQILRALDLLDELDAFLPDPGPSPLELAKRKGRERQRASRRTPPQDEGEPTW